jgi:hypothetical protein
MSYLLFDNDTLCNVPYPLNEIKYRLTFYKITGFSHNLNEIDYASDGLIDVPIGIRQVALGLPLGVIFTHFDGFRYRNLQKRGALSLRVGIEDVFMPFDPDTDLDHVTIHLPVHGDDIKKKQLNHNGTKILLQPAVLQALDSQGSVLYKAGDSVYRLDRAERVQYVTEHALRPDSLASNYGQHRLTQNQFRELSTTGKLTINYKGDDIEFFLVRRSTPGQRALSMNRSSDASELIALLNYAQRIWPADNYNEYDKVLGELLGDPRAGANDNRFGKDSTDAELDNFILRMPWTRSSTFLPFSPWTPFDLATLLRLHKEHPWFQVYISRFVPRPKPPTQSKPKPPRFPRYEIGVFSTYEQSWQLLGYSRGALLSSISLAPKEELNIEIFTFDRVKTENESTFSTEFESNLEVNSQARASSKVARDLTTTTDTKADIGLGIPLPAGNIPIKVQGNTGINHEVKEGIQSTVDQLNEKTVKSTERLKSTTQVKIVQSQESGEEKKVIRKIQNPNTSRTLTFNYFEVLENYKVSTKYAANLRLCLLVSNPDLGMINLDFVLAYEDRLTRALLSPIYQSGFDAGKKLAAQRWFEQSRAQEAAALEKSENEKGHDEDPKKIDKYIIRIAKNLRDVLDTFLQANIGTALDVLGRYVDLDPETPSEEEFEQAKDTFNLIFFWEKFKIAYPGIRDKAAKFVASTPPAEGAIDEATALTAIESFVSGLDDDWVSSLKTVAIDAIVGAGVGTLVLGPGGLVLGAVLAVFADQLLIEKNLGLPALITEAKKEVKIYQQATSIAAIPPTTDGATVTAPQAPAAPEVFSLTELATANGDFQRLLLHIEANKIYYLNKIWAGEIPEARLARFRLKGIDRYIDNQLLGFVGDKAAYPLRLDALPAGLANYLLQKVTKFQPDKKETLNGVPTEPLQDRDIESATIPTNGVYMEAMIGNCEALEPFLLDHRKLDVLDKQAEVDRKAEEAKQAAKETERYDLRLKQNPPLLEFPQPVADKE